MGETQSFIKEGRLISNGVLVVWVMTVLIDTGTVKEAANRCRCTESEIRECLAFARACIKRCTD
jgi:hypothetical protein